PDVSVTLLAWGEPRWFEHVAEARTDADGVARFWRVHAGRIGLHLDGGTQLRDDVVAGRETRMEAALERGLEVRATVIDERGSPGWGRARRRAGRRTAWRGSGACTPAAAASAWTAARGSATTWWPVASRAWKQRASAGSTCARPWSTSAAARAPPRSAYTST